MYGSGAPTGMEITAVVRRPILKVLTMGRTVCFVAASGLSVRSTVVLLSATTAALATASSALGSACPYKFCFKSTSQRGDEFFEDI